MVHGISPSLSFPNLQPCISVYLANGEKLYSIPRITLLCILLYTSCCKYKKKNFILFFINALNHINTTIVVLMWFNAFMKKSIKFFFLYLQQLVYNNIHRRVILGILYSFSPLAKYTDIHGCRFGKEREGEIPWTINTCSQICCSQVLPHKICF